MNKGAVFGTLLILLSVVCGIALFSFLKHMDGFSPLTVRFLAGVLGLMGFLFTLSGGFLIGKGFSVPEGRLLTPLGPMFATVSISLGVLGFLWAYLSIPWYGDGIASISYWVPAILWAGGGFILGSKRVTEIKFTWRTALGGFMILLSVLLALVLLGIAGRLDDLSHKLPVEMLSLVGFFSMLCGGSLLARG